MTSVYFFNLTEKTEYDKKLLPQNIRDHCKKSESIAAATELLNMGVENLRYEENGKPIADNCFVSISHSGDMVAVCTSEKPIGIDIEFIDEKRNLEKLSNRVFCGKELETFKNSPTPEQFYKIWTQKEAYSKIDGQGVNEIMSGFDIFDLQDYDFHAEIVNDYVLSICEKIK